jgi:tetratricopeptide (TPR) repeat protein
MEFDEDLKYLKLLSMGAPTISQINFKSLAIHFLLLMTLVFIFQEIAPNYSTLLPIATCIGLMLLLRNTFGKFHREGMKRVKKGEYEEAISYFEDNLNYFEANPLIDKYRVLTLMSVSKMSYREMSLCNLAFCHSQIGNGARSRTYYEQVLEEYPNNNIAKTAINFMNSQISTSE